MVSLVSLGLALLLSPLLVSAIHRTKAWFAGRRGPPLLQPYAELRRLLGKGAVYSRSTTWVFRAGPVVGLASIVVVLALIPFGGVPGLLSFEGDLFLFAYLLGLMRFFTVLAALDTGSSFEGMGASREVFFSALAEPALLLGLAAFAWTTGTFSLSEIFSPTQRPLLQQATAPLALVWVAVFLVYLTENARIPVDDPGTHLELTMIHEVMVLDHSGPDLAYIEYGAALKLWALGSLLVSIAMPVQRLPAWAGVPLSVAGLGVVALMTGIVESTMARLRLTRVPQMLVSAGALSLLALVLAHR